MAYEGLIAARMRQKNFINGTDLSKISDVEIDVFIALADLLNRFPHTGVGFVRITDLAQQPDGH